jgi:hypothetical protein
MVHKTCRKDLKDKALELALTGRIAPSENFSHQFIFRAPRASGGPRLVLELNLKRLDLLIAPGADVFSFPHIISGI